MGKLNTIIGEELKTFLNEGYVMTDDRFKFKQRLNNSRFYGYETFTTEFDTAITGSDIIVNWRVLFWLNEFGIENLIVDVESVEGTFLLEMHDLQSDELMQETPKNIRDFSWKFIVDEVSITKGGSLYITELLFDFKNKTCRVLFSS